MWYAVETVLIDGTLFGSRCLFEKGDTSAKGHCYAPASEEPLNSCEKFYKGRIEIHVDWFETEELAEAFSQGRIMYIHHYDAFYKKEIKSTLKKFRKRELVIVNEAEGIVPYKGIYKEHMLEIKPYWCF